MFQVIFNQGVTSFQEMFLSDFNGGGGGMCPRIYKEYLHFK